MQEEVKNKMDIPTGVTKDDKVTIRAVSVIKNQYHFPGSGKWKPHSVVASTIEEATEIWLQQRIPVNPIKPPPEKVEAPAENKETKSDLEHE
jgi:hypothetical protein